jgi:serine/threonine protein kinase
MAEDLNPSVRRNHCGILGHRSLPRPEAIHDHIPELVYYPMSLCINPDCKQTNLDDQLFCKNCGSEILLLGRYQVVRLLSEKGGFADTYEVMHHGVARVLKVLKDSNPKAIELFQREFEVLNRSDHPGIPKAEEYFEFQPRNGPTALHCLVMEKILGIDLEEYIKQRGTPIDERCAINWLDQIAHILQEIHNQNLLHRDIKPSNIILQPDGQLALIDFGAVGRFDAGGVGGQPPGTFIFTPGYAAQEQTMGRAVPQSDFFSLGRTFVYLLTGKQIAAMRDGEGEWNWQTRVTHLSPALVAQVERMMNESVEERPASATELINWVAENRPVSRSSSNFYSPAGQGPTNPATTGTVPQFSTVQPFQTGQPFQGGQTARGTATTVIGPETAPPPKPPVSRKGVMILGAIAGVSLLAATAFGITLLVSQSSKNNSASGGNSNSNDGGNSVPVVTGNCAAKELVKKSGNLYGVVEIGSKGIKAAVIQELDQLNEDGFKYKARDESIATRNTNASNPTAQDETVKAVSEVVQEIQKRFSVPCEQIVIYGSSGLAKKAPHKDKLTKAIQEATGRNMDFISAADEAKYVFDGVTPEWRRDAVITVDIGSGNTKGAFLKDKKDYETYEVPVGTGDFSREIDQKRGDTSFVLAAEKQRKEVVIPQIRNVMQRKPALQNSPRIYLAGGISWALATLTHPCDPEQTVVRKEERVSSYTRLRAEDINTFYNNATRDRKTLFQPNLSTCKPEQLKKVQKDIAKIQKDTFSENDLIAGAEILRAFSQELKFAEKDSIFFARYAIDALPIGYLIQQLETSKK